MKDTHMLPQFYFLSFLPFKAAVISVCIAPFKKDIQFLRLEKMNIHHKEFFEL